VEAVDTHAGLHGTDVDERLDEREEADGERARRGAGKCSIAVRRSEPSGGSFGSMEKQRSRR
jgi:hypothetical protein